jgi:hypothetical protein
MNEFLNQFADRIQSFYKDQEQEKQLLLTDILSYANLNPEEFNNQVKEIGYDKKLMALSIIMEALSKDTDRWGDFYVDLLEDIFSRAKQSSVPKQFLMYLSDFAFIERDRKEYVQRTVSIFDREIEAENIAVKLAAIENLGYYMHNDFIKDTGLIIEKLRIKLNDANWKVRHAAFTALQEAGLLRDGDKLQVKDKLMKLLFS